MKEKGLNAKEDKNVSEGKKTKRPGVKRKIKKDSLLGNMITFFNQEVKKKTVILFVIAIILYIVLTISFMNVVAEMKEVENITTMSNSFWGIFKSKMILMVLVALSGLVPYFYIPVIAFLGYVATIASDVAAIGIDKGNFSAIVLTVVPVIFDLVVISIMSAIGIYMCKMFTKKFKYSQRTSFGFSDVKIQIYEIRGQKEKADKLREEKQKKIDKMETNNVKINYTQIFYFLLLTGIVEALVSLIYLVLI